MLCEKCPKRNDCKVPCERVERILRRSGIYEANWTRPKVSTSKRGDGHSDYREIPFSSLSREDIDRNPLIQGGGNE